MRVKVKFDKTNNCFAFNCPHCDEYTLMTGICEDEEEILNDGGEIEYWCDICDTQVQVHIDTMRDECPKHYEDDEEEDDEY